MHSESFILSLNSNECLYLEILLLTVTFPSPETNARFSRMEDSKSSSVLSATFMSGFIYLNLVVHLSLGILISL